MNGLTGVWHFCFLAGISSSFIVANKSERTKFWRRSDLDYIGYTRSVDLIIIDLCSLWARNAIFRSSVCKNGEVYTPETSCMKWTSVHIKNMWIKQLCNRKVRDFALALPARKFPGLSRKGPQARVVWKVDNAIHLIKSDPVNKCLQNKPLYPLDSDLSGGYRYPPFEQPGPVG